MKMTISAFHIEDRVRVFVSGYVGFWYCIVIVEKVHVKEIYTRMRVIGVEAFIAYNLQLLLLT